MQVIGAAVTQKKAGVVKPAGEREHATNPFAGDPKAIAEGKALYENNCASCHGPNGKGDIGPSLVDDVFLYVKGDLPDDAYFEVINNGTSEGAELDGRKAKGGMPGYSGSLDKNKIWSLVAYIRSIQSK
jgi:mono/diheme cytochrome c family protein